MIICVFYRSPARRSTFPHAISPTFLLCILLATFSLFLTSTLFHLARRRANSTTTFESVIWKWMRFTWSIFIAMVKFRQVGLQVLQVLLPFKTKINTKIIAIIDSNLENRLWIYWTATWLEGHPFHWFVQIRGKPGIAVLATCSFAWHHRPKHRRKWSAGISNRIIIDNLIRGSNR